MHIAAEHLFTGTEWHSPGVVEVDNGRVTWSGPAASGNHLLAGLLMPGLVNVHAHTPMALMRGLGDGLPTGQWLREVIWPREAHLTTDDIRIGMSLGAAELLANGITTTVEMYFAPDVIGEVAAEYGLRCVLTPPILDGATVPLLGPIDEQVGAVERSIDRWAGHPLVSVGIGPHSAYTLDDRTLARIGELARRHDLLVQIHLAEQRDEPPAVARLDAAGLLGPSTLAAHCVWLSDDDVAILAERDVAVAHCPISNARHASGVAPIVDMLAAGVRVGLGTDGPVSDPRLDLFEAMRAAQRTARLRDLEADRLPAAQALHLATVGAADAIGRPDLGRLSPGARADIIHLELPTPDIDAATIVDRASGGDVRDVWVDGYQVVVDGHPTQPTPP
jgi:5-methylthioadenosine/S-adenosylhomocysteine deaminase